MVVMISVLRFMTVSPSVGESRVGFHPSNGRNAKPALLPDDVGLQSFCNRVLQTPRLSQSVTKIPPTPAAGLPYLAPMEPSPHILTDDDLEIRDMLARFPVTNGYQVVTAADRPVDGGWR
jgi:hypothetical protein